MGKLNHDILKEYVEKFQRLETENKKIQQEMQTFNQSFNDWMQKQLGVTDENRNLHLSEIVLKWSEQNGDTAEHSRLIHNS